MSNINHIKNADMKTTIKYLLAVAALLSIGATQKAEAQNTEDAIPLVYNNTTGYWELTSMPSYDVKLVVEYYSELNETENNSYWLDSWNGETKDIVLVGRTLQPGYYNSFAVPFDIPASKYSDYNIAKVKKLTGSSYDSSTKNLSLTFADENVKIEAGKPYLVKVSSLVPINNPRFDEVTVSKTPVTVETTAVNFVPTFGKTLVTGYGGNASNPKSVLMLGANNKLSNPKVVNDTSQDPQSYMKGFRAYFQLVGEAASAKNFNLDFSDGETTSISVTEIRNGQPDDDNTYDLQGRRVKDHPTQQGVYIKNGKKIIIK